MVGTFRDKGMRSLVLSDFAAEGEIVLEVLSQKAVKLGQKCRTRDSENRRECWELKENIGDALNWVY